jgi:hypothetical protein
MQISKHINTEVITIIVSTIAIVFSINSVRTDLDNKIDKVYEAVTARMNQAEEWYREDKKATEEWKKSSDERWADLLGKFHELDKKVR